jgi:integration host factor subunit alpha
VATFHASAKLKEQIHGSIEQSGTSEVEWSLGAE